jgi:hypothetical protein
MTKSIDKKNSYPIPDGNGSKVSVTQLESDTIFAHKKSLRLKKRKPLN